MVERKTDSTPALAGWAARCKEHGLTFTAPRQAIVRTLLEADGPLDAVAVLSFQPESDQPHAARTTHLIT
ncbi:MAG: hypothetical protein EPN68_02365 [Rhodanobacter sp.]|uniref:Transcriptional repressor n=1 Tax=Rhodanobacter glycinis TaxID=582702 RepID=A0A5B9E2S3_9GAMM|nr:hypothetical protein [Rhodanobacter glycinis]QEE25275.1 hypothetical protein CS053_12820 [Rhodanobacter glycinis]TAM32917.1 MAG: hypothetical protein EPN68_02365 [Rhodanobacter sp.]